VCSVYNFPGSGDLGFVASTEFKMIAGQKLFSSTAIVLGIHMVQSVMIAIKVSTYICHQHCIKVFFLYDEICSDFR